jgi:hypothetical protein
MLNQELDEQKLFTTRQTSRIEQLELELTEMTNRLQSGAGSEAAQKRNDRMKQMLEKSSSLYAELQTRYQAVSQELEEEKQQRLRVGRPDKVLILSDEEEIVLNDNQTFSIGPLSAHPKAVLVRDLRHRKTGVKEGRPRDPTMSESQVRQYLRAAMLEFFVGDSSAQQRLIPVVLGVLECSQEQITAAQRGFAEGRQIIAKAESIFGL